MYCRTRSSAEILAYMNDAHASAGKRPNNSKAGGLGSGLGSSLGGGLGGGIVKGEVDMVQAHATYDAIPVPAHAELAYDHDHSIPTMICDAGCHEDADMMALAHAHDHAEVQR